MFVLTKGKRLFQLRPAFQDQFVNKGYTRYEASRLCAAVGQELRTVFEPPKWFGGTESAMFNRLEEIAEMTEPVTPFLQVMYLKRKGKISLKVTAIFLCGMFFFFSFPFKQKYKIYHKSDNKF